EIATRRDHVHGEISYSHNLAARAMHLGAGIAIGRDAEWISVDRAGEPIADMKPRVRQQASAMDRRVAAEEYRDLDRARRMQPTVGVSPEAHTGLGVVNGDGDSVDARRPLEGVDVSGQAVEPRVSTRGRGRKKRERS